MRGYLQHYHRVKYDYGFGQKGRRSCHRIYNNATALYLTTVPEAPLLYRCYHKCFFLAVDIFISLQMVFFNGKEKFIKNNQRSKTTTYDQTPINQYKSVVCSS